ncbi:hypothetical protein [Brevundimonas sp. M20]|uniref:hypothetical protein n=1 Tax=Brevundimonas sp. M20 TaxID=2591463 RepID=UPI001146D109|nr:hypothetical protein [Brevundimonas sp. M20]QDH73688.1 hypothetical protein FKQ52_09765 [Brevundimonas sp. M20]
MRKLFAVAALAGGLMIPLAGPSNARTVMVHECNSASIEAMMCGAEYDYDVSMCDLVSPGEYNACRGEATTKWARCMTSC